MSLPVPILVPVVASIRAEAERAYPHEGCGALLGTREKGILEAVPLQNRETQAPRVRFAVDPGDYVRVETEADRRGLELLGFWHSHPDHPSRPSATDRLYAWEGLLTLVISVDSGRAGTLTAWDVQGGGFRERPILEEPLPKEAS